MKNSCINIQYHSPNWLKDQLSIQVLQHAMNIVLIFFLILVLSDFWVLTQNIIKLELVRVSAPVIIIGRYVECYVPDYRGCKVVVVVFNQQEGIRHNYKLNIEKE